MEQVWVLKGPAQHGVSPKGADWGLGSATACWQGQGNAISAWEQTPCPPLPALGGYQELGM